jgi:glycerol-3-phosphate O-acyltransferase
VSFGEPIPLARVLDETHGSWRTDPVDEQFRPEWIGAAADSLGVRIMTAINDAAVINPVNLVALVLLSMPKQAIVEVELRAQLTLYIELAKRAPYAPRSGVSELTADEMVEHCERMAWLSRRPHELGDVLRMDERRAVLASYYRNNIVHLYALPALVAAGFVNRSELTAARLRTLVTELYPCLRGELFLRLGREQLEEATDAVVAAMVELGSLDVRAGVLVRPADGSPRAAQLRLCAEIVLPFIERYYLCISLLLAAGPGVLRVAELVRRCRAASEQLALIYSLNSPDLFQAELFDNWLSYLRGAALLGEDSGGALSYDEGVLAELAAALGFVLPSGLRQTLVNLAGAVAPPSSG